MIKNNFKTALRNLSRNKVSSLVNIGGLAVGMAVVTLIGFWIYDELSFDRYHQNYNRIARVMQNVTNNGEVQTWRHVPYPLADVLRQNHSGDFKSVVMSTEVLNHIIAAGDKKLNRAGLYIEAAGPELFSLKMLKGSSSALNDQSSVLISASTAKAYFGDADPLFEMLVIDSKTSVKVAGVYEDLPRNTTLYGTDYIASWDLYMATGGQFLKTVPDKWRPNNFFIYVQLTDDADLDKVSLKIKDEKRRHVSAQLAKKKPALFLEPMNRWHLYEEYKDGINTGGRIQFVWLFGVIGIFVLLLACINFMNLSTARSEKRAREVGIRKAIGSHRSQLVYQFFTESILCVFLAFTMSLGLIQVSLQLFNTIADKQMSIPWGSPVFWIVNIAFITITGVITGSYPAFYLSSFKPVKVLKGTFRVGRLASMPRKALVVLQFTVSVTLIIGTIIVFRQIQYAKDRPVGYDRNALIGVPVFATDAVHRHFDALRESLMSTGVVTDIAESPSLPTEGSGSTSVVDWQGKDPNLSVDFQESDISYDYGRTIGWHIRKGRDFSRDFLSDSIAVVLNESLVKFIGFKNPVGSFIKYYNKPYKVIGVVNDLVVGSPFEQAKPTLYFLSQDRGRYVLLRVNSKASASAAIEKISTVFKAYNTAQPFEYSFVDQGFAQKFDNEQCVGTVATVFAILAILISCLGLFGMASFMAEQRIKEIGVRKVLGASVFNLWQLLSKDFAILVSISIVVATPLAYYLMYNWLQKYQYRTGMAWWIFIATAAGVMLITLLTVSYQSIKAALANPVNSLRSE